jgi:hypothetical protein
MRLRMSFSADHPDDSPQLRHRVRRRRWAGAVALISALSLVYAPAASASSAKPAKLTVSPTSHNFGSAVVGTNSSSQSFAITNTGESTSGTLAASVVGTDPADFAIDADTCTGGTLAAGAACSVSVHFAPTAVGTRKATLSVTAAPGGTVTLTLQGTGGAAQLALSPTSHGYGSVAVGTDSPAQTYTLTNTGAGPSGPVAVTLAGANPSAFSETSDTCGAVLPAGSSCAVSIVFIPTAIGADTATLTASATPGGTVSASLTGTGAAKAILSISPASFDFGDVIEGTNSADQTFTVTNTGEGKSGTVTVGLGGTDPADFTQDSTTCGAKLAVGASCTVSVHFNPSAAEADDATLSVTADPGGTATATLQGTGTSTAILSIDPTTFDFGSVVLGSSSGEQTFTVTNSGQGDSGTVAVSVSGANQADFVVDSTTCGPALPGGGFCTISAHYTPSATGPGGADLAVTSTPGGTASSALQGTGITPAALSISPSTFDFGQTAAGASSGDQTFTVTNTGGAASGTVGIALTGSNSAAFTIDTDTCGAALPGGDTCSISVHFTAGTPGTNTAGLAATASPGGTATAALQGEALAPATLSINPQFYEYGLTTLGSSSAVETFTVTNTGQSPSGTVTPEVTGPDSYFFELIGNTCTSGLAAGASCTVTVAFDPFETGEFFGYLQVGASPGGSATAEIEGEAISAAYLYTTSPAPFSNVLLGSSSADQTITVTNEGQQTSGVVSAVLGGTDASDFTIDANTCTTALYDGQSCSVKFHFNPSAVGSRSATLTVSGTPGGSQTLDLQGTGVNELMINPTSYAFPNQPADTTSAATIFTLTNYGTTPMNDFGLVASDTTDFPITADTCVNATVAPGAACRISVAFNADALGQHSSSMTASLTDGSDAVQSVTFQVTGTSVVAPPDLATSMTVQSEDYDNATVQITVSNMGSAASVAATMTITVSPVQDFSYEAGAGTDCTATVINTDESQFTCPVPVIAGAGTYTRTLTIQNLSSQAPKYVQNTATTIMPGDTNSSNNTGYSTVTFD